MTQQRILKNTVYLYIRMAIVLVVQLLAVRVLLDALGANDYGLYNLIGGIVILFNFMNSTMRGATQRFLNYEMGSGNQEKLKATFSNALTIHLFICLILILLGETVGLWFVNHELVIAPERLTEANILYQLSLVTAIISTIQVPYNAAIIANESMHVYAIIEVGRSIISLVIIYSLYLFPDNQRLTIYGAVILLLNLIIFIIYILYCRSKFKECVLKFAYNKTIMRPMLSFSGWDLYGNVCVSIRIQGMAILLNIFFGTIVNAAAGIASSIQSYLLLFGSNVIVAFKPQIIKSYASQKYDEMAQLAIDATAVSFILFAAIAIPSLYELPYLLSLWLGNVPEYTVSLTRISILMGFVSFIVSILNIIIHATGDIKLLSFFSGTIFLVTVPVAYLALYYIHMPQMAYVVALLLTVIVPVINLLIIHRQLPEFTIHNYVKKAIINVSLVIICSSAIPFIINHIMEESLLRLFFDYSVFSISLITTALFTVLPKSFLISLRAKMRI